MVDFRGKPKSHKPCPLGSNVLKVELSRMVEVLPHPVRLSPATPSVESSNANVRGDRGEKGEDSMLLQEDAASTGKERRVVS